MSKVSEPEEQPPAAPGFWVDGGEKGLAMQSAGSEIDETDLAYVGKGSSIHLTYHIVAAVASVPTLSLPYGMASMGWVAGTIALLLGGAVTCYTSFLIASLSEFGGKRHLRYRDLAEAIMGPKGWWLVTPFQFAVCVGSTIANLVIAGQALKAVHDLNTASSLSLSVWIIIFGAFEIVVSIIPHFHALRWVNAMATFSTITFSAIAVGTSLYAGYHADGPRDYGVHGSHSAKSFGIANAMGLFSFAYGNTVIPEIQATARTPVARTMQRGISGAYVVILGAYITVAFTGYWAFGNSAQVIILSSLSYPNWAISLAWVAAVMQVVACFQVYCQPPYEYFERRFGNAKMPLWSMRNLLPRLAIRTTYVVIATFIACLLPFFGDLMGIIGALGYTPLDFVIPQVLWVIAYKPTGPKMWLAIFVAVLYTFIGAYAAIGSVRNIAVDASSYKVFANLSG